MKKKKFNSDVLNLLDHLTIGLNKIKSYVFIVLVLSSNIFIILIAMICLNMAPNDFRSDIESPHRISIIDKIEFHLDESITLESSSVLQMLNDEEISNYDKQMMIYSILGSSFYLDRNSYNFYYKINGIINILEKHFKNNYTITIIGN